MEGPMGLKMSEQEANEYLQGLLQGKRKVAGAEAVCLDSWKSTQQEMQATGQRLAQAQQQAQQLQTQILTLRGQAQAHVQLLIAMEEGRRNDANPKLTLVDELPMEAKKETT